MEIKIPWEVQHNIQWNETCAQIIEQFGLPGGRYTTKITNDWMLFTFNNEEDAFMCKILISDRI